MKDETGHKSLYGRGLGEDLKLSNLVAEYKYCRQDSTGELTMRNRTKNSNRSEGEEHLANGHPRGHGPDSTRSRQKADGESRVSSGRGRE